MTERRKDLIVLTALLVLMILFFSKILFTYKIVRAPDIVNEFYWGVVDLKQGGVAKVFDFSQVRADWNMEINSGTTSEGGYAMVHLLFLNKLLLYLFPAPADVAWFMVLYLFFGGLGAYKCCRQIGTSRIAALLGGVIFALATENVSLINAGHVMKIATIAFAPWAFYYFEKGFRTRRVLFFMATAVILAVQFFTAHWQIAFYTCLGIGAYGLLRSIGILLRERKARSRILARLVGFNLVTMLFFLSTVAISLVPLAHWSTDTNRGVQSGANLGRGGLERDEAMSWSLPPEELTAFVIPGFFGLSRQEGGANPDNIPAYYWGRMVFTQTQTYMGLLPWLLVPLPFIFRRDKYTWLAVAAVVGGTLFSMGQYTPFYNFLFDHFPGINRFRVPKMMMFIPVLGLGILAARGLDLLCDDAIRKTRGFRHYLAGLCAVPAVLLILLGVEVAGRSYWINAFIERFAQPTRYEQGPGLIIKRWDNLVAETAIAFGFAALCAGAVYALSRKWITVKVIPVLLLALYLADVWRVNDKFMFLVDVPTTHRGEKTPLVDFLGRESRQYRVLPVDGSDPMFYVSHRIPVMFTSNPVQQRRWQAYLDGFSINSAMPDILNVKYLIYNADRYQQEKTMLGDKYRPVLQSPDTGQIVLENRTVLPKGWLVPSVLVSQDPMQVLGILGSSGFDPRRLAVVETMPPIAVAPPQGIPAGPAGEVTVDRYEEVSLGMSAKVRQNALLVLGEKYYEGWKGTVDGKPADIHRVNFILRGIYLTPGEHRIELRFDPLPFKVGKYLTLASFLLFALMLGREMWLRRTA